MGEVESLRLDTWVLGIVLKVFIGCEDTSGACGRRVNIECWMIELKRTREKSSPRCR